MRSNIIEASEGGVRLAKAVSNYKPHDNRIFRSPKAKKILAGLLPGLVNWLASRANMMALWRSKLK